MPPEMLSVVVVKTGDRYTVDYPNRMLSMLNRHLDMPWRMFCLTDNAERLDADIEPILIPEPLPGWWNKLYLFSDLMPPGPVLYLDLDQVITGNLTYIVTECLKHRFSCYADHIEWCGVKLGTAMMTFWPEQWRYLFTSFWNDREAVMQQFSEGGDQVYLGTRINPDEIFYLNEMFPKAVKSYKYDVLKQNRGPDTYTRIVNFHGRPKPHEVEDLWVKEHWR